MIITGIIIANVDDNKGDDVVIIATIIIVGKDYY